LERFNILFRGEILPDQFPDEVMQRFGEFFGIADRQRIAAFFTGRHIILRRNLDKASADGASNSLRKLGLIVHVQKAEAEETVARTSTDSGDPSTALGQETFYEHSAAPAAKEPGQAPVTPPSTTKPTAIAEKKRASGARPLKQAAPMAPALPEAGDVNLNEIATARTAASKSPRPGVAGANTALESASQVNKALNTTVSAPPTKTQTDSDDQGPPTPTPRRKRRPPGAPNLFDLHLPEEDKNHAVGQPHSRLRLRLPFLAAALSFLAFALVALRFWAPVFTGVDATASGSQLLQVMVLVILLCIAAAFLAFGLVQSMTQQVFLAPADANELNFDINNEQIQWLEPAANAERALRNAGIGLALLSLLIILSSLAVAQSLWGNLGAGLLCTGLASVYLALAKVRRSHLGRLGQQLIVVDHRNLYRIGAGPRIQYFGHYVMIDNVIAYLGYPWFSPFSQEALEQQFWPLFRSGIKVDRATVQIKMLQQRHPMLLGGCALLLTWVIGWPLLLLG
jgi:hypothetical protein